MPAGLHNIHYGAHESLANREVIRLGDHAGGVLSIAHPRPAFQVIHPFAETRHDARQLLHQPHNLNRHAVLGERR